MADSKDDTVVHANFGSGKLSEGGEREITETFRIIKELESKGLKFLLCLGYNEDDVVEVVYGGSVPGISQLIGDLQIVQALMLKGLTVED